MPRLLQLLIGPELIWGLICFGATFLPRWNTPPDFPWNNFIDRLWGIIPGLALLTFALWYVPVVERNWLLLRVWVACLLGAHFALEKGLGAYSPQGPGIGMGYLAGMIFVFILLIAGSVWVKIRF